MILKKCCESNDIKEMILKQWCESNDVKELNINSPFLCDSAIRRVELKKLSLSIDDVIIVQLRHEVTLSIEIPLLPSSTILGAEA